MREKKKEAVRTDDIRIDEGSLFAQIAAIIETRKSRAGAYANREVTLMFWEVGRYINSVVLDGGRAEYGKQILTALSARLVIKYGRNFTERNLYRMSLFAERFPDMKILPPLAAKLSWSHFVEFSPHPARDASLGVERGIPTGYRNWIRSFSTERHIPTGCTLTGTYFVDWLPHPVRDASLGRTPCLPISASRRDVSLGVERGIPTGCHHLVRSFSTERHIPTGCALTGTYFVDWLPHPARDASFGRTPCLPISASRRDASLGVERGIPTGCRNWIRSFSTERHIPTGCALTGTYFVDWLPHPVRDASLGRTPSPLIFASRRDASRGR